MVFRLEIELPDLPGDVLACKLKQLPKTMDIPVVLYASPPQAANLNLSRQICRNIEIKAFVETNTPDVLFDQVKNILDIKSE